MWYGIVSRLEDKGFVARLDGVIHIFLGSQEDGERLKSLCGAVVRKKVAGRWENEGGMRSVVQVQRQILRVSTNICKKCLKKFKEADVAEKFLERTNGPQNHHKRDGV